MSQISAILTKWEFFNSHRRLHSNFEPFRFSSHLSPTHIGKESNRLEEIEAGVIHSPESVYTEYPDPSRDEWQTRILPILKNIPIPALIRVSGKSRSMLRLALAGRSTPRRKNQQLLKSILQRLGVI